jgi:hypothetical protein
MHTNNQPPDPADGATKSQRKQAIEADWTRTGSYTLYGRALGGAGEDGKKPISTKKQRALIHGRENCVTNIDLHAYSYACNGDAAKGPQSHAFPTREEALRAHLSTADPGQRRPIEPTPRTHGGSNTTLPRH